MLGVAASTAAADPRSLASGLFGAGDESEKLPVRIAFFVACGLWIVGQVTSWGEYGVLPFQIRTRKNVEQKKVGLWALCGIFESPYRSNRLNERFFKGGQPSNRLGGLDWLLLLTLAGALMFYLVCAKVAEGFVTVTITSYSVFSPLEYLALWLCMMLPLPFISMLILDQLFTWVLALTAAALSVLMKQRGGMPLKHLGTAKHAYDFGVNCVAPVWRHASTPKHAQLVETWNAIVAALRVDDLLTDAEASALSCESEAVRQLSDRRRSARRGRVGGGAPPALALRPLASPRDAGAAARRRDALLLDAGARLLGDRALLRRRTRRARRRRRRPPRRHEEHLRSGVGEFL